ncbi:MAG: hypothetical protein E7285_09885 [Lachnospiraceae bacterium]|nr:hypothetical protein [Lachnospiraceae bacterium]
MVTPPEMEKQEIGGATGSASSHRNLVSQKHTTLKTSKQKQANKSKQTKASKQKQANKSKRIKASKQKTSKQKQANKINKQHKKR